MDWLPPFRYYSLDAHGQHLSKKKELKKIRQYIQLTWADPPHELKPKMPFYVEHFMELMDNFIIRPAYTLRHWMHALRVPLGQFQVSS